jgi:hypothetical protein
MTGVLMKIWIAAVCAFAFCACVGNGAPVKFFKAGVAKLDVTPDAADIPKGVEGINDHVFVRAIVVDNGSAKAAMVTADVGIIPTPTWKNVVARAEKELKIPAKNILITATHTHSSPPQMGPAFVDKMVAALREAVRHAEPAVMTYGTGVSYFNVTFEVLSTHLKPGGAETAIVDGLLDLMETVDTGRLARPATIAMSPKHQSPSDR